MQLISNFYILDELSEYGRIVLNFVRATRVGD